MLESILCLPVKALTGSTSNFTPSLYSAVGKVGYRFIGQSDFNVCLVSSKYVNPFCTRVLSPTIKVEKIVHEGPLTTVIRYVEKYRANKSLHKLCDGK